MEESLASERDAGVAYSVWPEASVGWDAACQFAPANFLSKLENSASAGRSVAENGVEETLASGRDAGVACSVWAKDTVGWEATWTSAAANFPSRLEDSASAG